MESPVLEAVVFQLNPGVEAAALMAASESMMPDIRALPGFIRRELYATADGRWVDTVYWRTMEEAHAAAEAVMGLPCAQAMFALIDHSSITMLHGEPMQAYS